jgi:hypothetical protein
MAEDRDTLGALERVARAVFHILQVMSTQAGVSISPPPLFERHWCASVAER